MDQFLGLYAKCTLHLAYNRSIVDALRAPQFAQELEISEAVLGGDLEVIIKALKEEETSLTTHGLVLQDAKFFSISFTQLCYSHIRREGNIVAHNLVVMLGMFQIMLCGWRILHHIFTM